MFVFKGENKSIAIEVCFHHLRPTPLSVYKPCVLVWKKLEYERDKGNSY